MRGWVVIRATEVVVMELVLFSLGILGALIVVAAIMDLRARRTRRRLSVDDSNVPGHRHDVLGRADLHDGPL